MLHRITQTLTLMLLPALLIIGLLAAAQVARADNHVVTNANDDGDGSLRQAIAAADDGDTITFAGDYTIYLNSTLGIGQRLTIDGSGHTVTVSGDSGGDGSPNVQVFYIGSSGVASLTHLSIVSGTADVGSGIYNDGTLTMVSNTISGNSATGMSIGGGIYNKGTLTVQNSTISGNSAYYTGGIYNYGILTIQNSTIYNNSSYYFGGGIESFGTLIISNTIVAYNSPTNCFYYASIFQGSDHNLDDDGTCPGFTTSSTIYLGPLADYGGDTQTHALLPNSAAIDAGNDATCLTTDQRGITRPQGAHCDIGAFEISFFPLAKSVTPARNAPYHGVVTYTIMLANTSDLSDTHAIFTDTLPVGVDFGSWLANPGAVVVNDAITWTGTLTNKTALTFTFIAVHNGDYGDVITNTAYFSGTTEAKRVMAVFTVVAPEMAVLGNGQVIADGDTTPSATDHTDFSDSFTRTFTIRNSGALALNLTGSPRVSLTGTNAGDFSVIAQPATPIGPHATTTFQVRFTPSVGGRGRVATVTIANNDNDENPYDFAIQGKTCNNTLTVTNANDDSSDGTLRQAIADICPGGLITFASDYTIYLNSTLDITKWLTIDGSGHTVKVSGDSGGDGTPNVRVFYIGSSGVATLTHLSIVSGTTTDNGGGILNYGALTVQNSTLSGNSANYCCFAGGGIFNDDIFGNGTLIIQNSAISGNSAYQGGGIFNMGTLTVQNSTLSGNSATAGGGAIDQLITSSTALIVNSTIVSNTAAYSGGGRDGLWLEGGIMTINNSIVAYNDTANCTVETYYGIVNSSDHNLSNDSTCSGFTTSSTIYLGPLTNNGGDTQTHALLPDSAALDVGNNATCLPTDQRGIRRPQGAHCDIGAFEVETQSHYNYLPIILKNVAP